LFYFLYFFLEDAAMGRQTTSDQSRKRIIFLCENLTPLLESARETLDISDDTDLIVIGLREDPLWEKGLPKSARAVYVERDGELSPEQSRFTINGKDVILSLPNVSAPVMAAVYAACNFGNNGRIFFWHEPSRGFIENQAF